MPSCTSPSRRSAKAARLAAVAATCAATLGVVNLMSAPGAGASAADATAERKATEQELAAATTAMTSARAELEAATSAQALAHDRAEDTDDVRLPSPQNWTLAGASADPELDLQVAAAAGLTATELLDPLAEPVERIEQVRELEDKLERVATEAADSRVALLHATQRRQIAVVDVQGTTTAQTTAQQELRDATTREKAAIEAEAAAVAARKAAEVARARAAAAAAAARSMDDPVVARITSPYGMRRHPITGVHKLHSGTDFAPGDGVARAARAGTVVGAGSEGAYGTMVTLSHGRIDGADVVTRYAHLASAGVSVGQQVGAGAALGQIGSTGSSTGRHLHFEVLVNGEFDDPMTWLD